jgi:hypothetical protein
VRHGQTTQTMGYQEHRPTNFLDSCLYPLHPLPARGPMPILLFDPPEVSVPLFPDGLPMAGTGTIPAWND